MSKDMTKEEFIEGLGTKHMLINHVDSDDSIPGLQIISKKLWDEIEKEYGCLPDMYEAYQEAEDKARELWGKYIKERTSLPQEIRLCTDWVVTY